MHGPCVHSFFTLNSCLELFRLVFADDVDVI